MQSHTTHRIIIAACIAWCAPAGAQPAEVRTIPVADRAEPRREDLGLGARLMAVHAFFQGYPSDIRDARALLDARSITPAFNAWCGITPYVDFTNGTVRDSLAREAPEVMCLPFLDPARMNPAHSCTPLAGAPAGTYFQGGGYALRVAGRVSFDAPGVYTLAWGHDDGVSFRLGTVDVFEYADPTGSRVDRRAVRIDEAGSYPFTLEWFDTIGGALIDWYIADGDATAGPFTADRFRLVSRERLSPDGSIGCNERCERCPAAAPICDTRRGRCVRCVTDDDCGPCARCFDDRCAPLREVPGADGGPACAPDASAEDSGGTGAPALDAAVDASSPPSPPGGCGCRAQKRGARGGALALACALTACRSWRRRR